MAGKFREVEAFVTKPPKNPGAGQVHSKYSRKTGEVGTVVTKPLINPGAGQVYFECGSTHLFFDSDDLLGFFLSIRLFQLVAGVMFKLMSARREF